MSKKNNDIMFHDEMNIPFGKCELMYDFTYYDDTIEEMVKLCSDYKDLSNKDDIYKLKATLLNILHIVDVTEYRLAYLKSEVYKDKDLRYDRDKDLMERFLAAIREGLVDHKHLDYEELKAILGLFMLELEKINATIDSFNVDITFWLEVVERNHMTPTIFKKDISSYKQTLDTIANVAVEDDELNNMIKDVKTENIETILLNLIYRIKKSDDRIRALFKVYRQRYNFDDKEKGVLKVLGCRKYSRGFRGNGLIDLPDSSWFKILFTFGGPVSGIGARMLLSDFLFDDFGDSNGLGL